MSEPTIILDLGAAIKGNCTFTDPLFKEKIIVQHASFGVSHQMNPVVAAQQRSSGSPTFQDISISKALDLSSAEILKLCIKGTDVETAKIYFLLMQENKPVPYLTLTLTNAMISNYNISGAGDVPSESLSIAYAKIVFDYVQQDVTAANKGTATASYDARAAAAG